MSDHDELIACQRRFVAGIAHDLCTPMASLRGHIEELLDPAYAGDEDARRAALEAIARATERLTEVVEVALRAADPDGR